jgi:hypothetical protein
MNKTPALPHYIRRLPMGISERWWQNRFEYSPNPFQEQGLLKGCI